ncbi:ATP-binding cassette domain-containing protein [Virgibacillus dakarensis]|uniref:ABC transporter ATP-binding protein n=1 Tax=Lentibacillus populi TaxID=1827502 RepID=A0A9W5U1Z1_9BACI|nr:MULTISPECIES: ABC-F family ATP-binding cassette domain-containing protein [Bacillaceae]MBT2214811.1 ATP-binding cassette domain-containing protein [Virgibacillus dakarensis]MTW84590.1 ATP-binding cassette domain-containing protein [Virgibacillus dakarensis]GGB62753.1 ABC transporter ATP-binding protein [Lentibacillus populi]
MIIASLQHVAQTFGANTIFSDLTCEINDGDRIGLIGRNGEGKTTLLDLLARKTEPAAGTVTWKKGLTVGLLEQSPEIDHGQKVETILYDVFSSVNEVKRKMTDLEQSMAFETNQAKLTRIIEKYGALQEKFQEDGGYEIDSRIRRIMSGLKLADLAEKDWGQLSGGERTKVGLAKLLLTEPDLLLLDEPTNHLDLSAIEWLTDFIRQYAGTVMIVSHDRYFLDETVTSIFEMDQGELIRYSTNYTDYVKEREARLLREFQQYQDQQKKIKKMRETIKKLKEWANRANPPNDGLHRRAKSMEKALARMEVMKRPILEQKKIDLDFQMNKRSGKDVFVMESVTKGFDKRELFSDVSMHIRFQERIAIVGENGSGKSTILKIILGTEEADGGVVESGSNLSIGFLSQHMLELNGERTILDEFRDQVHVTEGEARGILAKFLFYGKTVFQKVKNLSGGEQMRLRLAQLVHQNHNLLILDEPTNHLDIESKEVLEEALEQFDGTIIAVSHDRYFLDRLFPITYWLAEGKLTRYEGSYTFARSKRDS